MTDATENYQPEETISGSWTDVSLVTDLGSAEETEVWLTRVSGDITVSKDATEWESEPNATRYEQSGETHIRREVEIPLDHNADEDLEEAEVFDDESGKELFNSTFDAIRLHVHKEREDDSPALEREGERVRLSLGDEEFSSGETATATLTAVIMGEWRKEFTEPEE